MMSLMFHHPGNSQKPIPLKYSSGRCLAFPEVRFPSVGRPHFRLQASLNEGEKRGELSDTNEPGVLQKAWDQLKNYRIMASGKPKVKYFGVTFTVEAAASALIIPESEKSNQESLFDAGKAIFTILLALKKREDADEVLQTVDFSWMEFRALGIDTSMITDDGGRNKNAYPKMSLDVLNQWLSKLVVNHLDGSSGGEKETALVIACGYEHIKSKGSSFKDKARMLKDQTVFMQLEAIFHIYKLSREGLYDEALKNFSIMGFLTVDDPEHPPLSVDVQVCIPGLLKLVRSCLEGATSFELAVSVLATLDRLM